LKRLILLNTTCAELVKCQLPLFCIFQASKPGKDLWMTKAISAKLRVNHKLEEDSDDDEVPLTYNFESEQVKFLHSLM